MTGDSDVYVHPVAVDNRPLPAWTTGWSLGIAERCQIGQAGALWNCGEVIRNVRAGPAGVGTPLLAVIHTIHSSY